MAEKKQQKKPSTARRLTTGEVVKDNKALQALKKQKREG